MHNIKCCRSGYDNRVGRVDGKGRRESFVATAGATASPGHAFRDAVNMSRRREEYTTSGVEGVGQAVTRRGDTDSRLVS